MRALTRIRVPAVAGTLALVAGVLVMLWGTRVAGPLAGPVATATSLFLLYFLAAAVFSLIWPRPSWAWGLWVVLPFLSLILLSVAFAGQVGAFLRHDLVPVVGAVGGGLSGGWLGGVVRRTLLRPKES